MDEVDWFTDKPMNYISLKRGAYHTKKLVSITAAVSNAKHFIGLTGSLSDKSKNVWDASLNDRKYGIYDLNSIDIKVQSFSSIIAYG